MDFLNSESQQLCSRCRSLNVTAIFESKSLDTVELGAYQVILSNKDCPFCMLVIHALSPGATKSWKPGEYPVEMCYLGKLERRSTSPAFDVWFEATSQTLPRGRYGHGITRGQIMVLDSATVHRAPAGDRTNHGQIVGKQMNFAMIRSWLDECTQHHDGTKCGQNEALPSNGPQMFLIDVERMRLERMGGRLQYMALSYVWGKNKGFLTMKDNMKALQQVGALRRFREALPTVINDAIDLVGKLGQRYLWVDALCIVQDDSEHKREIIQKMDQVYREALLTIVALSGSGADEGLPRVYIESRRSQQRVASVENMHLINGLPSFSDAEQKSIWHSRGWTFQEGILAYRRLYVSEFQVYWQCGQLCLSEDGFQCQHPTSLALRGGINDGESGFPIYASLVLQYSPREMTYHSDSLHAFMGVLSQIRHTLGWEFVSALPAHLFPFALLWVPQAGIQRRPCTTSSHDDDMRSTACASPSWCWSAWSGHVYWNWWRQWSYVGKEVSLVTGIETFVIKDHGELRTIMAIAHSSKSQAPATTMNQKGPHWAANIVPDASPHTTLFFEAKAVNLDKFSLMAPQVISNKDDKRLPAFIRLAMTCNLWIYDEDDYHCGTLYGLWEPWKQDHDSSRCEFVLLGRSYQDKVTDADIEAYKDRLPPEYPSCSQYYDEVFDTAWYGYEKGWALNLMLIEWKGTFAERVAVGCMHVRAWDTARQKLKRIVLA
ncbi:hypothetical protein JX265_004438 [Neoarthrinium moseri]|uniref:Heterokaryon incompatibility domain-containing protein n=1 Tax=Neoarthrinium moseri TaxID=1658444 RepID=A0A9Q0ANR4_9PEZI|nr:hypothetical protein JX265_004438 [Neoarthrinium moseri]